MKPVVSLLTDEVIEDLASRSNFRAGKQIAEEGDFEMEKVNTFNIIARVVHKSSGGRKVELMSTTKGLRWKCTCTAKKDFFCKHCVALALHSQPKK